jgi:LPXTG-site transpeptidase (sortase) family protein
MVSSSSRPGVFLLAIATMLFSLVLLSATSSGAQTEPKVQGKSAKAAAGDEECVQFEDQNGATGSDDGDTPQPQQDINDNNTLQLQQDGNQDNNTLQPQQDAVENEANQQTQGVQDQSENGALEAQNVDEGNSARQSQQDGSEDEGDQQSSQDVNAQDDGSQDLLDGGDNTTSSQTGGTQDGECVVADTVPNESLLPTGAPASSSRTDEKTVAQKKSDRDGERESRTETTQEKTTTGETRKKSDATGKRKKTTNGTRKKSSSGTQKKATGGEANGPNRRETQNTSGSSGTTRVKPSDGEAQSKSGSGGTVAIRGSEVQVDDRAGKEPRQEELKARARSAAASDLAPRLAATQWTRPSSEEVASTGKLRTFAPDPNAGMTLSVRALGLYDMPVKSSDRREDLDSGLVHVPETSSPWDEGNQKNVFIAGHYLGAPQTLSRLAFYNLHELKRGDDLLLEDGRGQTYKYRVSEKFAVEPGDSWAMGEVRGRDMVTLQTCIPPDFGKRLMVRADRVRD